MVGYSSAEAVQAEICTPVGVLPDVPENAIIRVVVPVTDALPADAVTVAVAAARISTGS